MPERTTNRWRAAGVVACLLATSGWALPAHAADGWHATLERQSALTTLSAHGRGELTLQVRTGGADGDGDAADLSVYAQVRTRSGLGAIIDGTGAAGVPLSSTGRFVLNCRSEGVATVTVAVDQRAGPGASGCAHHQRPRLGLDCAGLACAGVYPLAITTTNGSATSTIWTLLAVTTAASSTPLALALVLTSDPASEAGARRETSALHALAGRASALTLAVDYRGESRVLLGSDAADAAYRRALARALGAPDHELVDAPPPSVDFAALAAHHLAGDVVNQARLASSLANRFLDQRPDTAVVLSGRVGVNDLSALASERVRHVIVPDGDLRQPPSASLQWGTPFRVDGASRDVVAMATDGPLHQLAQDDAINPARRAALTIGELALLHFQAPFAPATRTVVLDASLSRTRTSYLSDLLDALRHDTLVRTVALSGLFNAAAIGANGYPTMRALNAGGAPAWSANNASTVASVDADLLSLGESVSSLEPTIPLRVRVLAAERRGPAAGRQRTLEAVQSSLAAELADFHIDDTTITLTGTGTPLPITLTSSANYSVTGFLSLSAPGVQFPEGNVVPITLDASTDEVRIPANISGPGNFTLVVRLVTSNRHLVIALGAIQVRSTTTSVVGYVLTGGALAVIALWWWRTTRRRVKGRHAR
jgi:hypothetical protein